MSNYSNEVNPYSAQQVNNAQTSGSIPGRNAQGQLELMFGPPTTTASRRFGQDISSTHDDLYKAYEGDNLYLADTVLGFILQNVEWFTSVVPWLRTNQMHVKWNTFEFNHAMAQPVPAEGISRIISHKSRENTGSTTRYGIAFVMEGDMIGSLEGTIMYRRNIQGISQACQETVNFHTIYQLLVCKDYRKERSDLLRREGKTLETIQEIEATDFANLAYNREGFTRMVERQRDLMRDYDCEPDALIVFPRFTWYNDFIVMGTYTEYYQTGPQGVQILTRGPTAPATFRGIPVFESRDFNAHSGGVRFQPLAKRVAVGEYYHVTFEAFRHKRIFANYESSWRDIAVYDIDKDGYKKITFRDIMAHSRIFGGQGIDQDGLNPATFALAEEVNAAYDVPGGFEAEASIYGNPKDLETTSVTRPPRKIYMMLAHNVNTHKVAPVKKWSQFDLDVVPTLDMLDSARSLASRLFSDMRDSAAVEAGIEDLLEVADRLERAPHNDLFLRALVNENIDRSINNNGEFVGWLRKDLTQVIDWNPNAYGGLDLPLRDNLTKQWPVEGSYLASYPMIKTLAIQGEARGYAEQNDDLIRKAKSGIAAMGMIHSALMSKAKHTGVLDKTSTPDWIHGSMAESAIFNFIHVSRPPPFLGIPSDQHAIPDAGGRKLFQLAPPSVDDRRSILWQVGNDGTLAIASTLPRYELMLALLQVPRNPDAALPGLENVIQSISNSAFRDDYLENLYAADLNRGKILEVNAYRDELLNGILNMFHNASFSAEQMATAQATAKTLYAELKKISLEKGYDISNAKEWRNLIKATKVPKKKGDAALGKLLIDILNASVNSYAVRVQPPSSAVARGSQKTEGKGLGVLENRTQGQTEATETTAATTTATTTTPGKLISGHGGPGPVPQQRVENGNVVRVPPPPLGGPPQSKSPPPPPPPINFATSNKISQFFSSNISEEFAVKPSFVLQSLREDLDSYAYSLAPFAGYPYELGSHDAFSTSAAAAKNVPLDLLHGLEEAHNKYMRMLIDTDQKIQEILPIGNEIPVPVGESGVLRPTAYFRAPLAMSPITLRSLATNKNRYPMILPADPNTHYRTFIRPYEGSELSDEMWTVALNDPTMGAFEAGRIEPGTKNLSGEPYIRNKLVATAWENPFADWRYACAGTQGTDRVPIGFRQRADGKVAFEEQMVIAANVQHIQEERAAAGLPPRPIALDIAQANEVRADLERSAAISASRRQTVEKLRPMTSEMMQSGVHLSTDPVARARARSMQQRPAADDPSSLAHYSSVQGKYPFQHGAYPGAKNNNTAQYQTNRGNDMLPDPRYMVNPSAYYNENTFSFNDRRFNSGNERGCGGEFDFATESEIGLPYGANQYNEGQVHRDAYGRVWRLENPGGVNLGRNGMPIDEDSEGGAALKASPEWSAEMHPNSVYRYQVIQTIHSPIDRLMMAVLYEMPNRASAWHDLIDNDIHVPINFLVWRLFIEFDMYTCILMQSGVETAVNMLGPSNMAMSNSAADKMVLGHFTFHHAPFVFKEEFISHLNNVYPKCYVAGWNTEWLLDSKELRMQNRGSLIATPIAITENIDAKFLNFGDVTRPRNLPSITNRTKSQRPIPDYSSASFAEKIWVLSERALFESGEGPQNYESSVRVQTVARRGKFWSYDIKSESLAVKHVGTGHLSGNRTGPGVAAIWLGQQGNLLPDQTLQENNMVIQ